MSTGAEKHGIDQVTLRQTTVTRVSLPAGRSVSTRPARALMRALLSPHRTLCQALALLLAIATGALAQGYSFRFYGAADGLQNLAVLSLAQDRAGYIWAGTEVGLYR